MFIQVFPSGPFETNAYVVACDHRDGSNQAAIVDPAPNSTFAITDFVSKKNLKPIAIWLTHSHWDHIADVSKLKAKYNIPVYIHPLDAPNLKTPGADQLPCWILIEGVEPDVLIDEGDSLSLGNLKFTVIHTPGHSPGGVCLHCPEAQILLSGDTLFKGTIGNLSFPTAEPDLMWISLQKLAKLPPSTKVYPGHGPDTTIGNEDWLSRAKQIFE